MKGSNKKKLLLAFDGSFHAMEAARYAAEIPGFRRMEIVLFHVFASIPDYYYDLGVSTPLGSRMKEIHAWDVQRENEIKEAAEKARSLMIQNGVREENLRVSLHERKVGVARDIVAEAKKGYTAVVVGRKGVSRVKDLIMGSITAKLLEKINFAPLIIVGRNSSTERVLIAMDSSEGALKAADFASETLGESKSQVLLTSVIRGQVDEYADAFRHFMENRFDEVKNFFVEAGLPRGNISTSIVSGAQSRAGVICRNADEGGFGTIIVGRRGLSKVKEFFMGRVSNKIINLTRDQAVWIVN